MELCLHSTMPSNRSWCLPLCLASTSPVTPTLLLVVRSYLVVRTLSTTLATSLTCPFQGKGTGNSEWTVSRLEGRASAREAARQLLTLEPLSLLGPPLK